MSATVFINRSSASALLARLTGLYQRSRQGFSAAVFFHKLRSILSWVSFHIVPRRWDGLTWNDTRDAQGRYHFIPHPVHLNRRTSMWNSNTRVLWLHYISSFRACVDRNAKKVIPRRSNSELAPSNYPWLVVVFRARPLNALSIKRYIFPLHPYILVAIPGRILTSIQQSLVWVVCLWTVTTKYSRSVVA